MPTRGCPPGLRPDPSSASAPGASPGGLPRGHPAGRRPGACGSPGPPAWPAWPTSLWRAAGPVAHGSRRAAAVAAALAAAAPARRRARRGRALVPDLRPLGLPRGTAVGDPGLVPSRRRAPCSCGSCACTASGAAKPFLASTPRSTSGRCTAALHRHGHRGLLAVVALSAVQINVYFGLNHTVSDLTGTAVARIQPLEAGLMRAAGGPGRRRPRPVAGPAELPDGVIRKAVDPRHESPASRAGRPTSTFRRPTRVPPGPRCRCWSCFPASREVLPTG